MGQISQTHGDNFAKEIEIMWSSGSDFDFV